MERYEEASSNQYSEEVQILLRVKEARDGKTLAYNTHTAAFKPPVEVLNSHIYKFLHNIGQFFWCVVCLQQTPCDFFFPESRTEEQAHSEGCAGLGCRFAHN